MSMQVGAGIAFGAGITITPAPTSFTLTSADIVSVNTGYGCEGDTTGFSIGGDYNSTGAFYNPYLISGKQDELLAFWNNNGLLTNKTYLFDVTWGPGSSTNTPRNVMVIGYQSSYLVTGTVDTDNVADWDMPGQNPLTSPNMKAANGQFNFPATFTLIQPHIQDIEDWC